MAGRTTRRQAEVPLTEEERFRLNEARAVVAELSVKEPAPEELSELGYERRMARGRAMEIAAASNFGKTAGDCARAAAVFYDYIWNGEIDDA